MAIQYGVLRGHPDRYKREDNVSTPHLQIRVLEDGGQPWRIAVNVQSDAGANAASNVAFWVVDPLVGQYVDNDLPCYLEECDLFFTPRCFRPDRV